LRLGRVDRTVEPLRLEVRATVRFETAPGEQLQIENWDTGARCEA